jgi:allantoate deiminase/N-carbamoyl-L-amino-acid hydrolase
MDLPAHRHRAALDRDISSTGRMIHTLESLNAATEPQFVSALSGIFEHSPWIVERAARQRPFASRLQLLEAMCATISTASLDEQLALIRAHPELAGRAAVRRELTRESASEQRAAGLTDCTPEEFNRLQELNAAYRTRFDFPFILAVRGHSPATVIRAFERRLDNERSAEIETALREIGCIGAYRLSEIVASQPGPEITAMCDHLARFTDQEGGLTCAYLTPAHRAAAATIREWMLAATLEVEYDAAANVIGRWRCGIPHAKTLIAGSHYDTVRRAGRYDGRLGVLLPIVSALQLRQSGARLPFDLEIIAFSDEEGVRFSSTFLGSSAVAGSFDTANLDRRDADGVTMRDAVSGAGLDVAGIPGMKRDPRKLLGYIEVHIEQGPVLLTSQRALGVVTAIAGSARYAVSVEGQAGHAGTVPMNLRRDAAAAAAEIVLAVEKRCSGTPGLVGTVGRLGIPDGAINVIPGRCELTLDIRAADDSVRDAAIADILGSIERIAQQRKVRVTTNRLTLTRAATCSADFQDRWARSIARVTGESSPLRLPSGAGHDAMVMAAITQIGMLFVRCGNGGISHHPDETMTTADAELAALAFQDFLLGLHE